MNVLVHPWSLHQQIKQEAERACAPRNGVDEAQQRRKLGPGLSTWMDQQL